MISADIYCLSREEVRILLEYFCFNKPIASEHLQRIIDRASENWDMNIVASNYFLSIVFEQIMKSDIINNDVINRHYNLCNSMYFSIAEFNEDFINFMYNNKMPERRNEILHNLEIAKQDNNNTLKEALEFELSLSFDDDLICALRDFYEKVYN